MLYEVLDRFLKNGGEKINFVLMFVVMQQQLRTLKKTSEIYVNHTFRELVRYRINSKYVFISTVKQLAWLYHSDNTCQNVYK